MANTMRWRYGDANPVMLPANPEDDIEIGDLIGMVGGVARPATAFRNCGRFRDAFVGVAMQDSQLSESSEIRIATTGVFEFDCDEGAYELGEAVQVAAAGAVGCMDQRVAKCVTDPAAVAIGRNAKSLRRGERHALLVDIVSVVMKGGPQFSAAATAQ